MTTTNYSRHLTRTLDALRPEFTGYAANQEKLFARRSEIAPQFLKAFHEFKHETNHGLVAFVKELDRELPTDRESYRHHRSFQAAWYLVRVAKAAVAPKTAKRHSVTPYELLAAFIRTVLPKLPNHERAWQAIEKTSRWNERDIKKLRNAVAKAKPMPLFPELPRLVSRGAPRVSGRGRVSGANALSVASDRA